MRLGYTAMHGFAAVLFWSAGPALAGTKNVTNTGELLAAIAAAQRGDVLTLTPGTYKLSGATCAVSGTAAEPITVKSDTPLAAVLELDGVEGFHVTGAHWHFEGLDVRGVCASDDACEHAFHVTGGKAEGFVLTKSRVRNFNAQLKVNAAPDGNGTYQVANGGLVAYSEFYDEHPRATANPVTKLNIDGGSGWVVRGNYIHDFYKAGGNQTSYGAFMKSGGSNGLFERNLVVCEKDGETGGTRIGLSYGGGGTAPQFCAPAFDANVPCNVEHSGGVLRNNLIASCSDVGIYVNRAMGTKALHNTLLSTNGIDFRFDTTSGESHGNLLMGKVRARDGAMFQVSDDLQELPLTFFTDLYVAPAALDFGVKGDASALQKVGARPDVIDDYCGRIRPETNLAIGALEHSLGDCQVNPPPEKNPASGGGGAGTVGAGGETAGTGGGRAPSASGSGGALNEGPSSDASSGGCGCVVCGSSKTESRLTVALAVLVFVCVQRRRRKAA